MRLPTNQIVQRILQRNGLDQPDGRALHAYRCSQDEFHQLELSLVANSSPGLRTQSTVTAFALYASEWWRRSYEGGAWKWEPLLASVRWNVYFPELYVPLRLAWKWWGVQPVILNAHCRYLGTVASQGGLPLHLLKSGESNIKRFLRAVLREFENFRKVLPNPTSLAESCSQFLANSLRNEAVYQLGGELIEQIWNVRDLIRGSNDPISALDRADAEWRLRFPVDMNDGDALELIRSLLSEAAKSTPDTGDTFRVRRTLVKAGDEYQLIVELILPESIPLDVFQTMFRIKELPGRFEFRMMSRRSVPIATGRLRGDRVMILKTQRVPEIRGPEAGEEIGLALFTTDQLGERYIPAGGAALGELPWVFADRSQEGDRFDLIGQGTVRTRYPSVLIAVPVESGLEADREHAPALAMLGDRTLIGLSGSCRVETEGGTCLIATSSDKEDARNFFLQGRFFLGVESGLPIFKGVPKLYQDRENQAPREVPLRQIEWRTRGGRWSSTLPAFGGYQLRFMQDGVLQHSARVGIVPDAMSLTLAPGSRETEGIIRLQEAGRAILSVQSEAVSIEPQTDGVTWLLRHRSEIERPPEFIDLLLRWPDVDPLSGRVPFPALDARLIGHSASDGLNPTQLALDELYGLRVIAFSHKQNDRFVLTAELRAGDVEADLARILHFSVTLSRVTEYRHELSLAGLRNRMVPMFGASRRLDAHVRLTVEHFGQRLLSFNVERFPYRIRRVTNGFEVVGSSLPDEYVLEALRFSSPAMSPIPLARSAENTLQWSATSEMEDGSAWLVTGRVGNNRCMQPAVYVSASQVFQVNDADLSLNGAANLPDNQRETLFRVLLDKLESETEQDQSFGFLSDVLRASEGLPAAVFHVLNLVIERPRLLVQLLFKSNEFTRQRLLNLEAELPFAWWLVPLDVWCEEARRYVDAVVRQLPDMAEANNLAIEHLESVMEAACQQVPALTVAKIELLRSAGKPGAPSVASPIRSSQVRDRVEKLTERQQELLRSWYGQDWPVGPDVSEWTQVLQASVSKLSVLPWLESESGNMEREPLTNAPIAAAIAALSGKALKPVYVHAAKTLRQADMSWFDSCYVATLSIFLGDWRGLNR